jgi:nudix-type nucleoside diphosphatase (YffH/AdpP family)
MAAEGRLTAGEGAALRPTIHARAEGVLAARAHRRAISLGQGGEASEVEVMGRDLVHLGFHRLERWRIDHPRFDGARSGPVERLVSHVTDAATVLPWDRTRDRVLVVEQLRLGPLAKGDPLPWMLEPVAGLIDAGETAETTALRELEEEAGLSIGPEALRRVGRYYPTPGGIAQVLHSFVAECDLPDDAGGLGGLEEESEDIRAHVLAVDHLLDMVRTGEAANAPLILSAQWIALHRNG